MRNVRRRCWLPMVTLVVVPLALQSASVAQSEQCREMLRNGLYKTFNMVQTGQFNKDIKSYLSSAVFRNDFKDGKWGGSLDVIVDAVPIGLSANATDTQIQTFQQNITAGTTVTLSESFYKYAATRIPDVELARIYSDCLEKTTEYGMKIDAQTTEQQATFFVRFRNQVASDPMPKVTFFQVRGGVNVMNAPAVGTALKDVHVITADRVPNNDLTLAIETDRGARSFTIPAEPSGFNADLPVGTVISSFLNWQEFDAITKNNSRNPGGNFFASKYSKWAPADGRAIGNSRLEAATGWTKVPDIRGKFLRGLNTFDPTQAPVAPAEGDPDTRTRGSFQDESFKSHSHSLPYDIVGRWQGGHVNSYAPGNNAGSIHDHGVKDTGANGGNETRPKNIAVYYYVRIN